MTKISFLIFSQLLLTGILFGQVQKRPLTHDDILKWERITETVISNNGKYIVYKQEPWKGDPVLKVTTPKAEEILSVKCATNAIITSDSKWLVYSLQPAEDSIRQLKLKNIKKEDLPVNKLAIYNLATGKTDVVEKLVSVKAPENWAGWIAYQTEARKDTANGKKTGTVSKPKDDEKVYPLFLKNLVSGEISEFPGVSSYLFAEDKTAMVFISEGKDSTFDAGIYHICLSENKTQKLVDGKAKYRQLTISKTGDKVAFLAGASGKHIKEAVFSLYYWNNSGKAKVVADNTNTFLPGNWEISENGSLFFSENGNRLFFGSAPKKTPKDTTILEEEIPVLDIWHWNENELQSVQIVNKNRDLKKSYLAVYHIDQGKTVQLETKQFSGIRTSKKGDATELVAWSNHPYAVQSMWEGNPDHVDIYLVDIQTGKAKMTKKNVRAIPQVSPEGKYLYWYNGVDTSWNTYHIVSGKEFKVTSPETVQCADELNDVPNLPDSYRTAGWTKNDESFLVYDRFDIWKVDPQNLQPPVNISKNGRQTGISYRLVKFDNERAQGRFGSADEKPVDSEKPLFLEGHNEITRADGYYKLELNKTPVELYTGNFKLNTPKKAKEAEVIVFTKEDFQTYPNLQVTDLSFKKPVQVSDAAPQQKEFIWGTAELVSWTSLDGLKLEGTLHKPENFDPSKKYPLIVNFYEKSSQELLNYRMPELHRSTIDYHLYTSNGYLVFNPDIYYKIGYPGEDAFNCVMPGITALIEKGFVDEKHIGAQGHSWGGYQVAYLATRTNLFAAIGSGAPVVNMFSAYGGIRWTTGLNRSFQYEHTQSRIGNSIWETPLRYLENSPLFTLDKINTPILIMANDDDGAVPWYQGIEFFIGLRRLQKPAWLLNYNEADHWPTKLRDKEDFQIRMAQFFDHYLKGKPIPKWMETGIPATEKGIDLGY